MQRFAAQDLQRLWLANGSFGQLFDRAQADSFVEAGEALTLLVLGAEESPEL